MELSGSIGLSHNKFLAKVASDLDKPRGFAVIGKAETAGFLAGKTRADDLGCRSSGSRPHWKTPASGPFPISCAGTGAISGHVSGRWGIGSISLHEGEDRRRVSAHAPVKSISNETTFNEDTHDADILDGHIWRMAEKVASQRQGQGHRGSGRGAEAQKGEP